MLMSFIEEITCIAYQVVFLDFFLVNLMIRAVLIELLFVFWRSITVYRLPNK